MSRLSITAAETTARMQISREDLRALGRITRSSQYAIVRDVAYLLLSTLKAITNGQIAQSRERGGNSKK
jgi:hypothetical protein